MQFLMNCWYVAGWNSEFRETPVSRTILGQDLIFFRDKFGAVAALRNRCPHRFAPLSLGKVHEGLLQCPYHGLQFNSVGQCVLNPHTPGPVDASIRIRTYPVRLKHAAIWIWMGQRDPDELLIPDFSYISNTERYHTVTGVIPLAANYALMNDNLLDLTHVAILHEGSLGSAAQLENLTTELSRNNKGVTVKRVNKSIMAAPFHRRRYAPYETLVIDKTQCMHYLAPSNFRLEVTHHEAGNENSHRTMAISAHLLTPETDTTSHYFWAESRDYDLDNEEHDQMVYAGVKKAIVNEDCRMVAAQQKTMGTTDFLGLKPKFIPTDGPSIGARRILDEMLRAEADASAAE